MKAKMKAKMKGSPVGSSQQLNVAIVGATGAVGQEFLSILHERDFPIGELRVLASPRSAGKRLPFGDAEVTVEPLEEGSFRGVDLALFSAGGSISKAWGPLASEAGAVVVDNSSAFRMDPEVPLVVPELNGELLDGYAPGRGGIIANPNCSTIILLMAATPLHRAAGVKRMVVSTYQSASGAGAAAMAELESQSRAVLAGEAPEPQVFAHPAAFNVFSHDSEVGENGYNQEEMKMVRETHKIWDDPEVAVAVTCVRVPVMRAHAESVHLTLGRPVEEGEAFRLLEAAPGVRVVDDREGNHFPMPLEVSGEDAVAVGRLRRDLFDPQGFSLFVCGDQLRKGAALNAVQIAERVVRVNLER